MDNITSCKDLKIGIFGLGLTGIATYQALKNSTNIICYDDNGDKKLSFSQKFSNENLVPLSSNLWTKLDKIVLSPGIAHSHEIFEIAHKHKIKIISDIDLLFSECRNSTFIGITGTNGKSTSTELIWHILKNYRNYAIGGNNGIASLSLPKMDGYILELSSFQLDLISRLKLKIAILLNISPDHLDRYKNMDSYIESKKQILNLLNDKGFAIINVDNIITKSIFEKTTYEQKIAISTLTKQKNGVSILDDVIYDNIFENIELECPYNNSLQGNHNRENIAASYAACRILGLKPNEITEQIKTFQGLKHRMEYLGIVDTIKFYNDSKATNSDAASKSIDALENIYWLAGGIVKEDKFDLLMPLLHKITKAYFFGKDKNILAKNFQNKINFEICEDINEATLKAFSDAKGDKAEIIKNILLAPCASSYDQFKNFEHRGEIFTEIVKRKMLHETL